MTEPDCLFCKIVAGDVPGEVVRETETTLALRDINPQAPVHVIVIPRAHHRNVAEMAAADPQLAASVLQAGAEVAEQEGVGDGYRLVFNTGTPAGQSVFHVHGHVLGGRRFAWPPG